MQCKGKYASKEENTGEKENILEERGIKTGDLGSHEKLSLI